MGNREQFDAATALGEVRRVERDVRARSRWQGWIWLLMAIITPIFLIGTLAFSGDTSFILVVVFGATSLAAWYWETRQTVVSRVGAHIDRPLTWIFVGAIMLVTVLRIFVLDDVLTTANVIVALLPSVPCLIGVWKIFRQ